MECYVGVLLKNFWFSLLFYPVSSFVCMLRFQIVFKWSDVPGQHKQVLPGRGEVFGCFTRFLSYTGKGRAFCLLLNLGHGPWCVGHVRSRCLEQGSNLCPLHAKCWVLTTGPPRKSHIFFNKWHPFSDGVEKEVNLLIVQYCLFLTPWYRCFFLFPVPTDLQGMPPPYLQKWPHPNTVLFVSHEFSNSFL